MFLSLLKFEINYFRKQPSFYVTMLIFFLMPFLAMVVPNIQIGASSNVYLNSPSVITSVMLIMGMIGIFLIANFIGNTGTRDLQYKMEGIIHSKPIDKKSYLWGRFFGSYLFCLIVFSMVPLGYFLGTFFPTVDAERLGQTTLVPYIWCFFVFIAPTFLTVSIFAYAVALRSKSMTAVYLTMVGFFITYTLGQNLVSKEDYRQLVTLLDPFGLNAYGEITRYWTPHELNNKIIPFTDLILYNRLLWLSITTIAMLTIQFGFDFRKQMEGKKSFSKESKMVAPLPNYKREKGIFSISMDFKQFFLRTKFEVLQIVKSSPFLVLCLFSLFNLGGIFFTDKGVFGVPNWPLSRVMADYILGSFSLLILIVMTYYSAESVWRERSLGIGDLIDCTPVKNWVIYFPKLLGLSTVIISLAFLGVLFTTFFQLTKSYTNFEFDVYAGILLLKFIFPTIMQTILAVFIQVISPGKYIGMLIFVGYIISSMVISDIGIEHNMWHFSETPSVPYSDLNGFGHFLFRSLWYNIYWLSFSFILMVVSFGMWGRGIEFNIKSRLMLLRRNIGLKGMVTVIAASIVLVASGSYIHYNTKILNSFYGKNESMDMQADYEKKYKKYAEVPKPKITDVSVKVDFFPMERRAIINGYYLVVNKTDKPMEKFILNWDTSNKNYSFSFKIDEVDTMQERDDQFGFGWVHLNKPIAVGQQRKLYFTFDRKNVGFVDGSSDTRLVFNGSFIDSLAVFPSFGYNKSFELNDKNERRKRDLPSPERLPKLEDATQYSTNMFGSNDADFVNFEAIVSTDADQLAIAPGYLQNEWIENNRHYFQYKMDAPILNFYSFLSGKWEKTADEYKGVKLEIYHHPTHNKNIERMMVAIKKSLDYYGQEYSPYQHRQVRIIEFPLYSSFAQSFPNTIPFSEDIGFISDLRDEDNPDIVTFVTAHEMAHQWWAHQVTGANVQGSAVLSETLSEYSAYMVMEKLLGKHSLRKFLKVELDRYLSGRRREIVEEMPLYKAENQQYIHYQKGGVVMYALRDQFGEEPINRALKKFLEKFQYASNPYPTTLDLLAFLKAEIPESGHGFVDELFTKITLFDVRVKSAVTKKLSEHKYQTEITYIAKKFYANGVGEEEEVKLEQDLDVGVFAIDPDKIKDEKQVLYLSKHKIISGENKLLIETKEKPIYAGVDPYIKMIDRNSNDNVKKVDLQ